MFWMCCTCGLGSSYLASDDNIEKELDGYETSFDIDLSG